MKLIRWCFVLVEIVMIVQALGTELCNNNNVHWINSMSARIRL